MSSTRPDDEQLRTGARRRGRPKLLSEDAVIEAALRVTERTGLDDLTMGLVAEELGMSTMAAYNYVPTKQALLERVGQAVLGRVELPDSSVGPWDERFKALARNLRDTFRRYPGVVDALRTARADQNATRLARGAMDILLDAGLGPDQAQLAFITFYAYMIGQIRFDDPRAPVLPQPHVRIEAGARFEFGLDILLAGFRALIAVPSPD